MTSIAAAPGRARAGYSELSLAGSFRLSSPGYATETNIRLPGDVHTALLEATAIPDPYVGTNEKARGGCKTARGRRPEMAPRRGAPPG